MLGDDSRYCGECEFIKYTPIGAYCKKTGENLDKESCYSHNKNDTELLKQNWCLNANRT